MSLYRIAYVSASEAHSVVRQLAAQPVPGDQITLDPTTVVRVRKVIPRPDGDTIAAEVIAEVGDGSEEHTAPVKTAETLAAPADTASRLL